MPTVQLDYTGAEIDARLALAETALQPPAGATDGQVLTYDDGTQRWVAAEAGPATDEDAAMMNLMWGAL